MKNICDWSESDKSGTYWRCTSHSGWRLWNFSVANVNNRNSSTLAPWQRYPHFQETCLCQSALYLL